VWAAFGSGRRANLDWRTQGEVRRKGEGVAARIPRVDRPSGYRDSLVRGHSVGLVSVDIDPLKAAEDVYGNDRPPRKAKDNS
jgi:hypothetical protein